MKYWCEKCNSLIVNGYCYCPTNNPPLTVVENEPEAFDAARVSWRDLDIGERLQPGDRIMQPDFKWATWGDQRSYVTENTYPCQRVVQPANAPRERSKGN